MLSAAELAESPLSRELYFYYGVAAHSAQSLEKELCLLLYFPQLSRVKQLDETNVEKAYEELDKKELGKLLKILRGHFTVDQKFDSKLDEARKKRNFLIHHFFADNAQRLSDPSSLPVLTQELKSIAILLQEVLHTIRPFNQKLREEAESAKAINERHSRPCVELNGEGA